MCISPCLLKGDMRKGRKVTFLKEKKDKPKYNMWQNVWYMVKTAKAESRSVLVLASALILLGVGKNLLGLLVVPAVLTAVETAESIGQILTVILGFTACIILLNGLDAYGNVNTLFGRVNVRTSLIGEMHEKICKTSYPNLESTEFQEKSDKAFDAVSSNSQATEAIWGTLTNLLINAICFVIWLLMMRALSPAVIAVIILATGLSFWISRRANRWTYEHREEEEKYLHRLSYVNRCSENFTLAKDLRIFGMDRWLTELYEQALALYETFKGRGERVLFASDVAAALLTFLQNGIGYGYLIAQILKGQMSAVEFVLYFNAMGGFTGQLKAVMGQLSVLHRQSLDISCVREFLDAPESFLFDGGKMPPADKGTIVLKNVSFRYPGSDKDTLKDINLTIRPGEKLAVVGLNGAGKTTLIKLICGFYDPTKGAVLFEGGDIRTFDRRQYYQMFSAVFQHFSLLAGSVAENVAQNTNPEMELVKECAERAGMKEKIESLPEGYETKLEKIVFDDAVELSGGELQRLMMARALYKNGSFLVLDEPTAALDPLAENEVYRKYDEMAQGRTAIYISHRLASTRFCDRIILIDGGRIAEEGTHEQLLWQNGKYAEMFAVQSKYYKEGGHEGEG